MLWKTIRFSRASEKLLRLSSIDFIAGEALQAVLRTMKVKPSLETRRTEFGSSWSDIFFFFFFEEGLFGVRGFGLWVGKLGFGCFGVGWYVLHCTVPNCPSCGGGGEGFFPRKTGEGGSGYDFNTYINYCQGERQQGTLDTFDPECALTTAASKPE